MLKSFKWLFRIFLILSAIAFTGLILLYYFAISSIPDYSNTYTLDNEIKDIEIVRDNKGVPHVFGSSDKDVYFGLGFSHAQDRLWQMTLMRRTAQGRLSEIFGEETLKSDEFIRRLGIYDIARSSLQYQSPEAINALLAYSEGINAWLKILSKNALGRGAPEFFLFKPEIEPWSPTDSLAILKLMAIKSSDHLESEILRAQISLMIGNKKIQDILPDDPSLQKKSLLEFSNIFNQQPNIDINLYERDKFDSLGQFKNIPASNIWAAHPKRTTAKSSLLAADPHNNLSAPGYWSLARLELNRSGVIGATIPGLPIIMSGRSKNLAWGFASGSGDDTDIYIEELNPLNINEYKNKSKFVPFTSKKEIIKIYNETSKTIDLLWANNRPVIPNNFYDINQIMPENKVASIRSTALEPFDKSFSSLFHMMSETNLNSAQNQFEDFVAPIYNMVLADRNNISLKVIGKIPKRNINHVGQGRIPSQGWLERNQWEGYFSYEENPGITNPEDGIVANTNNKTTDKKFPNHITHRWGDNYRIKRLSKLMNERKIHTRDSFMEAQLDTISIAARTILPLIAKELWYTDKIKNNKKKNILASQALNLLADWNGEMNEHMPEPLIYSSWISHFQKFLIRDELGSLSVKFNQIDPIFLERVLRDINNASSWCDVIQSSKIETCDEIAVQSLISAVDELSKVYGNNIENWQWGEAHTANHKHQIFGSMPIFGWLSNISQTTSGGDNTLMRAKISNFGINPFENVHSAGYRMIVDFSDLESSLFIISTGQSGHILSNQYDNLANLWKRGDYIPMVLDPKLARAGSLGTTILKQKLAN